MPSRNSKQQKDNSAEQNNAGQRDKTIASQQLNYPPPGVLTADELRLQLHEVLEILQRIVQPPYQDYSSLDHWPSVDALNRLLTLIKQLGVSIGIKKVDAQWHCAVLRRVNQRYPTLRLIKFVERLSQKINALPLSPLDKISIEFETCSDSNRRVHLHIIKDLLNSSDLDFPLKTVSWSELGPALFELSNGQIAKTIRDARPKWMGEIDFRASKELFAESFAFAAFLELHRQLLLWRLRWGLKVFPVVQWISTLNYIDPNSLRWGSVFINEKFSELINKHNRRTHERIKKRKYRENRHRQ